tara:strand:- start:4637 stop:7366 length:2730 start_codon:yes stop_codon:yes gene_type:complete
MSEIIKGFPQVSHSITNPSTLDRLIRDRSEPFAFLEFIKTVSVVYEPDTLQAFYTEYLNRWNTQDSNDGSLLDNLIITRYRDFIQDIEINFTSNAEKKFLSLLDYTNTVDQRVAISFISRKIRDIVTYYQDKRDDISFNSTKNKIRGSIYGVTQYVREAVIDLLDNRQTAKHDYDIEAIKGNIAVDVKEYFDVFENYFNQEPDEDIFGRNGISYEATSNVFLTSDADLIDEVFSQASSLSALRDADTLFENKRDQVRKYIGTDFYYISTNSLGDHVYDNLLEADAPYKNFLNQKYPTVASIASDNILSEAGVGYFTPDQTTIAVIDSIDIESSVLSGLPADTLVIFPDPAVYTNQHGVLSFIINIGDIVNNLSMGMAINQPITDKSRTSFHGYSSKLVDRNLNSDLSSLYDQGYISDSKQDIYGNTYGLVKDDNSFNKNNVTETPHRVKSLIFNGYQFFDSMYGEGFAFDYDTVDTSTYAETIRSGLSSMTNSFSSLNLSAYNMFFRYFSPYQELQAPANFSGVDYVKPVSINVDVKDGAYFTFDDTERLADPVSSDLSAFTDSASQFYFSELIEGGIASFDGGSEIVRALSDATHPAASGDFTQSVRLSGSNGVVDLEAGLFTDVLLYEYTPIVESYDDLDTVYSNTVILSNIENKSCLLPRSEYLGKIYVKNRDTKSVAELTSALSYIGSRYSATISDQLSSSVLNFDIMYDTLFIETSSYMVVDKVLCVDGVFEDPITDAYYLSINEDNFSKLSNRYKKGQKVYFTKLKYIQDSVYDFTIYPEIYEFDYLKQEVAMIFPTAANTVASNLQSFKIVGGDTTYHDASKPYITYSEDNRLFNISFIVRDLNKSPYIFTHSIDYTTGTVAFVESDCYIATTSKETLTGTSSYTFSLSSVPLSSSDLELVL